MSKDKNEFRKYLFKARDEFVVFVINNFPADGSNTSHRVECENILIAYDQMIDKFFNLKPMTIEEGKIRGEE